MKNVILYVANKSLGYTEALRESLAKQFGKLTVVSDREDYASVFSSPAESLVVVAGVETMPYGAKLAMQSYLESRGRVLLLGGPAFEKPFEWNSQPVTRKEYRARVIENIGKKDKHIILDTSTPAVLDQLSWASDNATEQQALVGNYGLGGSANQLFYRLNELASWATLNARIDARVERATVLSFYAKPGDDRTDAITFVIEDSTGARWRTKLPFISREWFHYVFASEDFQYFTGGKKSAPYVDLTDIVKVQIAFEINYSKNSQGAHSCYLSDVTLSYVENNAAFAASSLDIYNLNGVTPMYEQFPITNAANISADTMQAFVADRDYVLPKGEHALVSRHAGICGIGYNKNTDIRFIPLLTAKDKDGLVSGYVAWIDLYATATGANGPNEGAVVGYFGATTDEFYNADGIAAVTETALAMTRNTWIVNGGTTEHTYIAAEADAVTAGVQFVTLGDAADEQTAASVTLYQGDKALATYSSRELANADLPNSIRAIEATYSLTDGTPDRVVATLLSDGQIIDRVEHNVYYWSPKPEKDRSYIYMEDGCFKRNGEVINFFGVNYYPSYTAAAPANNEYKKLSDTYGGVCARDGYDPIVIQNELMRIKNLGMNAITLPCRANFIKSSNNLLDLLRICEELGLYVEVSLAGVAYPLRNYNAGGVQTSIKTLHLDEMDHIISYDICWEERIGSYTGDRDRKGDHRYIGRASWDGKFTEWVNMYYGSIEHAEQAWGVCLDRTEEGHLLITDAMLDDQSGKYQKAIAVYYRFLDDIVSTTMEQNLAHLKSIAPHQLITFRMSMSGSSLRTSGFKPSTHCFDFQSLASNMSYMEPEGYQLNGNDQTCLQVMFANAYARYTKPCAPIVWKEFGKSVWHFHEDGHFHPGNAYLADVTEYYRYVLDYCLRSHTAGIYAWWSIGGYRLDEDSDYGIFNPDGSDRGGITALLREYAPKFLSQGKITDTVYIPIERDDYTGGLFGMFDAVKQDLAVAYADGKSVTFIDRSHAPDGSYAYADTLLDQYVADVVSPRGTAPLRYVNGIIKSFDVLTEDGKTYACITVCNTKQSIWRAGSVSIVSTDASDINVHHTIAEQLDYLEDATLKLEIKGKGAIALRFEIGGVQFGPCFIATID